ncbi:MAG: hypothetical protein JJE12_13505 [Anaerolineales bacterium]|nr:hypothetical protein [Anaerolineales bacterium]
MNDLSIPIIIGIALAALPVGAGILYFQRRNLGARRRKNLHPLLILGIIFLFPGIFTLVIDGEESVYLSLGIVFTISGITAQFLQQAPPDDQARRYGLTASLLGFSLGVATGAVLSLVFGWSPILLLVVFGALGLLVGMLLGRFYRRRIQA